MEYKDSPDRVYSEGLTIELGFVGTYFFFLNLRIKYCHQMVLTLQTLDATITNYIGTTPIFPYYEKLRNALGSVRL
mgnify:CR=1 FL=1